MERSFDEQDVPYVILEENDYVHMMAKLSVDEFEPPIEWFQSLYDYKGQKFFIIRDKGENYVIYIYR